jgi:hypothetical protein
VRSGKAKDAFSRNRSGLRAPSIHVEGRATGKKGRPPHSSQRLVFFADALQAPTPFTLRSIRQERVQRELELRHVCRQLKFTALPERFRDRSMQHKYSDNVLDDTRYPVVTRDQPNTSWIKRERLPRSHNLGRKVAQ